MRGFEVSEFANRTARAQALMAKHDLAALLLTTEPELRYFTGYLTRFWESPTRPWFLIVPSNGKPVAVIPSIGADLMGQTWIEDIRTWSSPDLEDDGVGLLIETLNEVAKGGRVGLPDGHETHVRMPKADLDRVANGASLTSDASILRRLRMVKSPAEIDKVAMACQIAGRAFARVPEIAREGVPLEHVFRNFQMLCLEEGADWVPYLAGGAGPSGYRDVISPATPAPLAKGDLLMLDTGLVFDGYFCDFDRNWSVGAPDARVQDAYRCLIDATQAGAEVARPGAMAADVFHAMNSKLGEGTDAGRLGHGLGMSLTEWPSLISKDQTVLEQGMILTLEPGISIGDQIIVHEEDILITDGAPVFLSPKAGTEIPLI